MEKRHCTREVTAAAAAENKHQLCYGLPRTGSPRSYSPAHLLDIVGYHLAAGGEDRQLLFRQPLWYCKVR